MGSANQTLTNTSLGNDAQARRRQQLAPGPAAVGVNADGTPTVTHDTIATGARTPQPGDTIVGTAMPRPAGPPGSIAPPNPGASTSQNASMAIVLAQQARDKALKRAAAGSALNPLVPATSLPSTGQPLTLLGG